MWILGSYTMISMSMTTPLNSNLWDSMHVYQTYETKPILFLFLFNSFIHSCILPGWSKALQLLGIWDWWEDLSGDEPCKDHDAHFSSQTCHHLQVGLHFSVYFPLDLDVGDKKWAFGEVNCELNCGEFLTRWEVIDKDSSLEEGALFPRLRSGCPIWVERVQLPNINRIEQLGH